MHASVIERLTVILHYAENRDSISEICRQFKISRSTFHRWMERFDPENLSSLADKSHEPLTSRQSAIDPHTIELIRRYRMRYPQMGKERIAEILLTDHVVTISASSVGRIIERECLYFADTPFHWKKRLGHQPTSVVKVEEEFDAGTAVAVPVSHPFRWRTLKKIVLVSSMVTNIAFGTMLAAMAIYERLPERGDTRAEMQHQQQILHAAPTADYLP